MITGQFYFCTFAKWRRHSDICKDDKPAVMLKSTDYSEEELLKKREEAERKARRGEIDPVQEYTFSLISKITGLPRPAILNFMFEQPLILDELDLLYKTDTKKRVIFYYQVIMLSRHGFSVLTMTVRRPSI